MPAKIRLSRHGRKRYAYYHIVVADSRAPRDGRYIERIGSYNPNNDPATTELNFEKALQWIMSGAQPTDTVRAILSEEGVMLKKHLIGGVKKGAFDQQEADRRFEAWLTSKKEGTAAYQQSLLDKAAAERKERLDREAQVNEERTAALNAAKAELEAEAAAAAKAIEDAAAAAAAPVEEAAAEEKTEE